MELDEHGGMGIVPPVQNRLLCDGCLLGIPAKQVEEHLSVRRLRWKGRGYQEQEQDNGSGYHGLAILANTR